jgi:ribosome-binding protein aMBF1 (putative translation factor)
MTNYTLNCRIFVFRNMAKKEPKKERREKDPDYSFLKALGKRIVDLREKKGIKQSHFAKSINSYNTTLRRIEKGETNVTIDLLKKIADELGISVSKLLDFKA